MIVNLKYFKKQWSDIPAFGVSSFRVANADPRRTLYTLTALQLWFQSFSIILLVSSCLLEWYVEKGDNKTSNQQLAGKDSNHRWVGYGQFYFNTSLLFQICDVILSMYASYHLRNATIRYNNIQDVRIWIIVNNLYLLSAVTCFLFVLSNVGSLVICIKSITIMIFANYKIYIVHQIYKDEKSSYIILEQGPPLLPDSSQSTDENYLLPQNYVVEVEEKSTNKSNFEPLLYTANE
ncbi:uncharacterized protein LOC113548745 [Rhopalosiphum maidis]|uniref:uncharacterized protein LOC113548745 n=1 Tax=Rhopalosiphum maidis TaxID=43146 RepID=UPI000F003C37|nr:uncharacterized protein LOC113548745 [Rhopalosiphum maidis]